MKDCEVKIILDDATVAEYYELERILNSGNIKAKIVPQKECGTDEMGIGFNELVVLLPLLTPFVIQLRKIIVAYLTYKKPMNRKTSISLVYNDRKIKIDLENETIPDIDKLLSFFGLDEKNEVVNEQCKGESLDE